MEGAALSFVASAPSEFISPMTTLAPLRARGRRSTSDTSAAASNNRYFVTEIELSGIEGHANQTPLFPDTFDDLASSIINAKSILKSITRLATSSHVL